MIDAVCVLPHENAVALEMRLKKSTVRVRQLSDCMDAELLQTGSTLSSDHKELMDRERPHFGRNLIPVERVYTIRLFKITRHLCEQLVLCDADVDGKAKGIPHLICDLTCRCFRGRKTVADRCVEKVAFVDRYLLNVRSVGVQKCHQFPAACTVERMIRRNQRKKRTFPQGGSDRFAGMDTIAFGGNGLGEDDTVPLLFIAANDGRDRAQIHRCRILLQSPGGSPA